MNIARLQRPRPARRHLTARTLLRRDGVKPARTDHVRREISSPWPVFLALYVLAAGLSARVGPFAGILSGSRWFHLLKTPGLLRGALTGHACHFTVQHLLRSIGVNRVPGHS